MVVSLHQPLQHLDVALAVRVYRQLMDAGMVMTLQKLSAPWGHD